MTPNLKKEAGMCLLGNGVPHLAPPLYPRSTYSGHKEEVKQICSDHKKGVFSSLLLGRVRIPNRFQGTAAKGVGERLQGEPPPLTAAKLRAVTCLQVIWLARAWGNAGHARLWTPSVLFASLASQGQISSAFVFEKGVLSKISWGTLLYLGSSPLSFLRAHHVTIRTYQGHIPLLLRTNHKGIGQGTSRSHCWDTV